MARRALLQPQDLIAQLPPGQPQPAAALAERLGVNRMTLSRLVAASGDQVVRLGQTRATAYALRQPSRVGSEWPLYRLREDATLEELGRLIALSGDTFHLDASRARPNLLRTPEGDIAAFFPGLPWYLDDLRPQGFLGRSFAHGRARGLGLSADLTRWQRDDVLVALVHGGGTETGDLLLGGEAVQAALAALDAPPDRVAARDRPQQYPQRARAALAGEDVGSSPGGEQPKFTATVESDGGRRAVIVKFAQPDGGEAAQRWADLLVCEHLALEILRAAGVDAASSELLQTPTHTFLEVTRFDRSADVLGRRGFVSLLSLSAAFTGEATAEWPRAGALLQAAGWLSAETVQVMARLHAFGRLIGNGDMHQGNIGFHFVDRGPLPLAPAYDMLPMSLAPSRLGVLRQDAPLDAVAPRESGELEHLRWAAPLASEFWERVAGDARVGSDGLRALARGNVEGVRAMGARFG
ncbi:TPA: type II toxin-antitoxin system HipA family toxin YjjJ [Stenotrophomonas maltophilia]|uniref:Type II toxin-antitoxin system HipA family toxin YjjJ n=1 Tax=Stenotrophomonas maltophilia TaxID=40324 RepID=A0AAJ2MTU5_STEMA|nr:MULTISPECIES: type II toxin-antitoxin system HipA family toxin YjjJ [Stenotrophomonas]MDQ7280911.1 type II toxin-antitoxin system HipA family toxin YjjJ [Stenotrophomonas sp. Sm6012]MDT3469393.1 type II toxin-antitoxin system HipA family toxin YjjJ [Stenotrophomonas maltophilia]HDS1124187.1 type II toxin-antitoxin system HipA family toxin YjjJ [Stenotrophomonas maltophilia]HEL3179312.1 type II toxin-antitoxin system HipA family toxin YjjJ [Stenotrophomonas maltophilia]